MRDAHSYPLVGRRDSGGAVCATWREPPSTAWGRQVIELGRTATSFTALVFDCDSRAAQELVMASCVGAGSGTTAELREHAARFREYARCLLLGTAGASRRGGEGEAAWLPRARVRILQSGNRVDPGYVACCPITQSTAITPQPIRALSRTVWTSSRRSFQKDGGFPKSQLTEVGRNWALFVGLCKRALRDTDAELEAR